MGSSKDTMELFAERDLRRIFSEYDGWKFIPQSGQKHAGSVYQISRYKRQGEEIAFIAVSFDSEPTEGTIEALDVMANGHKRTKKFLLTPQASDTTSVPPHIQILRMNAFAVSDGKLVWLSKKKNAKKYTAVPAIPA